MITHVAIRFQGVTYSLPPPNRHHDVIRLIVEQTGVKSVAAREDDQGFLIDGEQYARRGAAFAHAKRCGQLKPGGMGERLGKLFSEDVW
jgi:archaellum component FlaG (FlaF/FlaG flagellin family)